MVKQSCSFENFLAIDWPWCRHYRCGLWNKEIFLFSPYSIKADNFRFWLKWGSSVNKLLASPQFLLPASGVRIFSLNSQRPLPYWTKKLSAQGKIKDESKCPDDNSHLNSILKFEKYVHIHYPISSLKETWICLILHFTDKKIDFSLSKS